MRALIMRLPIDGSFAQDGTRPHLSTRSWRWAGSSDSHDGGRSTTAYTSLVGATL